MARQAAEAKSVWWWLLFQQIYWLSTSTSGLLHQAVLGQRSSSLGSSHCYWPVAIISRHWQWPSLPILAPAAKTDSIFDVSLYWAVFDTSLHQSTFLVHRCIEMYLLIWYIDVSSCFPYSGILNTDRYITLSNAPQDSNVYWIQYVVQYIVV